MRDEGKSPVIDEEKRNLHYLKHQYLGGYWRIHPDAPYVATAALSSFILSKYSQPLNFLSADHGFIQQVPRCHHSGD